MFRFVSLSAFVVLIASAIPSHAQVTLEYEYDALGRLVVVTDPTNGNRTYNYDDAGNRTSLTVGGSGGSGGSGGGNQAPTANNLFVVATAGTTKNIFATSVGSDPDGDTIIFSSVSQGLITSGGASVQIPVPNSPDQTITINFTIQDPSAAQDSAVITIYIESSGGGPPL